MTNLTRDPACLKDLTWRLDLPIDDVPEAEVRLERAGYEVRSRSPVIVFDAPEGHRVIIVPRTGRVQLRLSYLVPKSERVATAAEFHRRLDQLWSERQVVLTRK